MKPDTEALGGVRLDDVAAALRALEAGPYAFGYLYERYMDAASKAGNQVGPLSGLGLVLTAFGCGSSVVRGEKVRWINVERLERNWPRLPWRV